MAHVRTPILTIDRSLAGQHHHDQLETLVRVLVISEHGLHLVWSGGVLTEARLAHDGHTSIIRNALELLGKVSGKNE